MSNFFCFALLLILCFTLSSASRHHGPPQSESSIILEACKASRDPASCESWLSHSGHVPLNATVLQVLHSALQITTNNLEKGRSLAQQILDSPGGNVNRTNAAHTCLDMVRYSDYRINQVGGALKRGELKDARAWMSAALVYQYDCWSALKYVNDTPLVAHTMSFFNSTLIGGTSSALSMLLNYDVYGDKTESWGPAKTERDGFWEPGSGSHLSGSPASVPSDLKPTVTVCKSGNGCNYLTVQAAVDAAPDNAEPGKRFVIKIKAGVYNETVRVPLEKKNVVFLGDGVGKTVITGSRNAGQLGVSTYTSATVGVLGDGFMARDLTIQNTAGPEQHQAVAFRSDSDHSIIQNCEILGNQDTLYAHSLRQYYKSCRIQGNVDFIFGNAAAIFDDCQILVAPRLQNPENGETNAVTAQGRTDPAQSTGFVFHNSVVNGTEDYMRLYYSNPTAHKNFLGRPWKDYARTVYIECVLEGIVMPDGWLPFDELALKTLYYGEYQNKGAGADVSKRVPWSSRIPAEHVGAYSFHNFVQGNHKWH